MINIKTIREFINKNQTEIYFGVVFLFLFLWVLVTAVPRGFQPNTSFKIEDGESLKTIALKLDQQKIIKSKTLFSIFLTIQRKDDNIVSGEYIFHDKESIFEVAKRLTTGDYGIESKTIILKEGFTLNQMANVLEDEFPNFDRNQFEILTSLYEGYFFPDTYIFPENADTELIVKTLRETFDEKLKSVGNLIKASGRTLEEIIIMASIVEKEATEESRQEVANILWHRMEVGMPLQVDATFVYERGKGTFDLTKTDLRTDSPYNTYTNAGLPPTAISNPGLESIKAAATIEETENLFFLTGSDGEMYYAKTHDEHVENKQKFLY